MNYTTAVFLINKNIRAIACTYECDPPNGTAPRTTFKTLDPSIKVGDLVVVPTDTRHKFTISKVAAVDVEVDFDSMTPMAWIADKVNIDRHIQTLGMEADMVVSIKSAETRKKREALRDALLADQADTIKALPIATVSGNDGPAIESPVRPGS